MMMIFFFYRKGLICLLIRLVNVGLGFAHLVTVSLRLNLYVRDTCIKAKYDYHRTGPKFIFI